MKCNQIEELLPLYVHSDLDRKRASAVAAHLAFCLHCRQITEEFEQAQQWMGLYEPSDFDDATFDDATFNSIRQNVLNEINRTAANSGLFELAFRFFRQRAFASVFAVLLVIISWVAFNLYVTRTTDVRDGAAGEQRVEKIAPDKKHNAEDLPTIVSNTPHTERVLPSSTGMLVAARRRYTSS
ncbi:MAG: zf-HC2 domain-containing protein, partial [Pyrinomonadaceae bacterium]